MDQSGPFLVHGAAGLVPALMLLVGKIKENVLFPDIIPRLVHCTRPTPVVKNRELTVCDCIETEPVKLHRQGGGRQFSCNVSLPPSFGTQFTSHTSSFFFYSLLCRFLFTYFTNSEKNFCPNCFLLKLMNIECSLPLWSTTPLTYMSDMATFSTAALLCQN